MVLFCFVKTKWLIHNQKDVLLCFLIVQSSTIYFYFLATPVTYGSSQARGRIGAAAAGLCHSHSKVGFQPHLRPTPQLMVTPDPWPTEQGQGLNPILMDTSQICFCCTTMGTPILAFLFSGFVYLFFVFLGLHLQHREIPRLGNESEL